MTAGSPLIAPDGNTRLYGILGHPVHSSLSPAFQNAAFRALGINALYVAFAVAPERLEIAVRGIAFAGISGFNLTVPHKVAILPLLDVVLPEARAVGAVNTVRCDIVDGQTRLTGTNTDGIGFLRSLEHDLQFLPHGKRILMLGSGGAARGIAHALLRGGAAKLWIANRTLAHAQNLAADLQTRYAEAQVEALGLDQVSDIAPHLLVNATTVGMRDGKSPANLSQMRVAEAVADIVYAPAETPLLAQARSLGIRCTNGIGMLLYQGAAAFEFWTNRPAPLEPMREALLAAQHAAR